MEIWTRRIVISAALLAGSTAGCTATVGSSGDNADVGSGTPGGSGIASGSGSGGGASTGAGSGSVSGGGSGLEDPVACTAGIPATSQLPRLTNVQYDNTIRHLTGLDVQPSSSLAPDTPGSVDQRAWDGYQAAAQSVAAQIMADSAARARVIPCAPEGDGSACADQVIQEFGQQIFRRPLTAAEVTRFTTLYANRAEITATGSFDEALELIIRAFLLSPSFLMRAETAETPEGQYFALSGYEIASRLSYMLWNSTPDDALYAAAAAGNLSTSEGILAEAQRMLADPKARDMVRAFHERYAHMGAGTRWTNVTRDPAQFPAFSDGLVPLLTQETERFFDYVVFDLGGTFQDLLTSPVAFVNSALAPLYNLDAAAYGADLVPVELDATLRPGVFTRVGFLTSYSLYDRSSPILRGAFLQKEVLCTPIGTPPPNAQATPLPDSADLTTNRDRVDAQTAAPECATCHHTFINPTGFALESFDAIGAYQTTEQGSGAPINTAATVPIGQTTVDVAGAGDLMEAIANSPEAENCYAERWVEYAYQRSVTPEDSCTVQSLAQRLAQDGYTVINLIADLTQSQSFRYRAMEVAQ